MEKIYKKFFTKKRQALVELTEGFMECFIQCLTDTAGYSYEYMPDLKIVNASLKVKKRNYNGDGCISYKLTLKKKYKLKNEWPKRKIKIVFTEYHYGYFYEYVKKDDASQWKVTRRLEIDGGQGFSEVLDWIVEWDAVSDEEEPDGSPDSQ